VCNHAFSAFRFLPTMCAEHCKVNLDEHGAAREQPKAATKRLDFSAWMLAWDRYALGNA
jgi:hypothetical protein